MFSEQMCLSVLVVTICHYCCMSSCPCVCIKACVSVTVESLVKSGIQLDG